MATTNYPTHRGTAHHAQSPSTLGLRNSADEIAKREEARRLELEADEREAATRPETD